VVEAKETDIFKETDTCKKKDVLPTIHLIYIYTGGGGGGVGCG
jgi:hypothetical protein